MNEEYVHKNPPYERIYYTPLFPSLPSLTRRLQWQQQETGTRTHRTFYMMS